jgi:predicted deacetylase
LRDRARASRAVVGARRRIAESGKTQRHKADAADGDSKVKLQTHERVPVTQFSS